MVFVKRWLFAPDRKLCKPVTQGDLTARHSLWLEGCSEDVWCLVWRIKHLIGYGIVDVLCEPLPMYLAHLHQ